MQKRTIIISLVGFVTFTLVIGGLNIGKAAAAEVIKLNFAHNMADKSHATLQGITPWVKAVEAATNGRVQITQYPNDTLVKGRDSWEALRRGAVDIALITGGFFPGVFPVTDVTALPVLPFPSAGVAAGVLWQLYEKFPEISNEFKDVKPLVFNLSGPYHLMTTAKGGKIQSAADWKGKKIRTLGGPQVDLMKVLGAVPMTISSGEIYTSLEKGIIDGAIYLDHGLQGFKLAEVVRYLCTQTVTFGHVSFSMSLRAWNNLPKDVQSQVMSAGGLKGSESLSKRWYDEFDREGELAKFAKEGYTTEVYNLTPGQVAEWRTAAEKIGQVWRNDMSRKGIDGQKILDELFKLAKEYK